MKKFVLIIICAFLIKVSANPQIGGLSASKLRALSAGTVETGKIEFEPSFMIGFSSKEWNNSGELTDRFSPGGHQGFSDMNFRFTYGLSEKIETGISVAGELTNAMVGSKMQIFRRGKVQTAFLAGVNINGLKDRHLRSDTLMSIAHTYGIGFVNSLFFSDRFSVDTDVQLCRYFSPAFSNNNSLFINSNAGYLLTDFLQIAGGLNYSGNLTGEKESLLMGEVGITMEKGKQFIIVIDMPFSIYGRNCESYCGVGVALTVLLD